MKLEYIIVIFGSVLVTWTQLFFDDESWVVRIILTIIGVAIAGLSSDIARLIRKKEGK